MIIFLTPDSPLINLGHAILTELPSGETIPSPVTTTLLLLIFEIEKNKGILMGRVSAIHVHLIVLTLNLIEDVLNLFLILVQNARILIRTRCEKVKLKLQKLT